MIKTRTPGIYKRGSRYVFVYKVNGRQRKESARTLDQARQMKAARQADIARGEFHEASRVRFREYAEEWVERYHGRGRRGFRESTREDYRRDLRRYAYPFLDERLQRTLSQITPRDIANFVAWLCEQTTPAGGLLADATVRRVLTPVRSCMTTAVQEGLIRHNPTVGAALPHRPETGEVKAARALGREQLSLLLGLIHPSHRLLFRFLASSGLRIGEAIALEWRHLVLDGSRPHVEVRQQRYRGRLESTKTASGRRDVPLHPDLVLEFRAHRRATVWPGDEQLVFPDTSGSSLRPVNVRRRVLSPAAEEADVPWVGFHTFRHTCASMLFERGANAVQVQHWLGHSSAAFTLARYVHLLGDDLGEALDLSVELGKVANPVATEVTEKGRNAEPLPVA